MKKQAQWFASLLKTIFLKDLRGGNRLIFNITGLFFVVVFQFTIGVSLFWLLHSSVIKNEKALEADLKHAYSIQTDLALLTIKADSVNPTLNRMINKISLLSGDNQTLSSWKQAKTSLIDLAKAFSNSEKGSNLQEIEEEFIRSKVLIGELIEDLIQKRQIINDKQLSKIIIYAISSLLVTIIVFGIGLLLLTRSQKNLQSEIAYFEGLAYQFKDGDLAQVQFDHSRKKLVSLNQALNNYIQRLRERYRAVKERIKKLNFQVNEIDLFSQQNKSLYSKIKQDLGQLITETYNVVDNYQVLAERLSSLDVKLEDARRQIFVLHDSFKNAALFFEKAPQGITAIETQVKKREQFLKTIIGDLYQLRSTFEYLLQTGSIFQNVAEQNTLLALNASIEAARLESSAGGFGIAAEEIAGLSEKIGRVSKELLTVVETMEAKGNAALRTLESDLVRNNEVKHYVEGVGNKIKVFCLKLNQLLDKIVGYGIQIEELEERRQSLAKLAASLGDINRSSQTDFGRAEAALEILNKSGETLTVTEQIESLVIELKDLISNVAI